MDNPSPRAYTRPYRAKNRRPCDTCRRRKHACLTDSGQLPCRICRSLGIACTFDNAPAQRPRHARSHLQDTMHSSMYYRIDNGIDNSISTTTSRFAVAEPPQPHIMPREREETTEEEPSHAPSPLWDRDFQDFWIPDAWLIDQGLNSFGADLTGAAADVFEGRNEISFAPADASSPPLASTSISISDLLSENTPELSKEEDVSIGDLPLHPLSLCENGPSLQHVGLSGEMDPYVLRHLAFNSEGIYDFGQYQCRQVSDATSTDSPVPVQFLGKSSKALTSSAGDSSQAREPNHCRTELEAIITPEMGTRLLGLFLRYVFPGLPVLSRSFLNMHSETLIPQVSALAKMPTYLLAATYAVSAPFLRYDPVLCVSPLNSNMESMTDRLWAMAYDAIMQRLHGGDAGIDILQTILIYLQKPVTDNRPAHVDNNSPSWFLVGTAVQLAFELGLHMDCRAWSGLPVWEKRLRRRLWWVVYSETIFRSLLTGNANPIHNDQWDVPSLDPSLDNGDFVIDGLQIPSEETASRPPALQEPCLFCHAGYDFLFIANLSCIAHQVLDTFYTYKATRQLANDFAASITRAAPLLRQLQEWKQSLPRERQQMRPEPIFDPERHDYFHSRSSVQLKLAFLTLHVLIYRGLLRPLAALPAGSDGSDIGSDCDSGGDAVGFSSSKRGADTALKNAVELIKHTLAFVQRLGAFDCNGLFCAWSSICFSTISNFLLLLLLVRHPSSPTVAHELAVVMARWPSTMRQQSAPFKQLRLGLYRIDTFLLAGLETTFCFPETVRRALSNEFSPSSSYKQSFPRRNSGTTPVQ